MTRSAALVSDVLRECGQAVRDTLERYLPSGDPDRYLYSLAGDYPRRGGKMMRSSICIATARVFGAPLSDALLSAAAIELLHNAFLVHDDVQDGSEMRRGAPTLHALHGIPLAINAGDAMFLLGLRPLLDRQHRLGADV